MGCGLIISESTPDPINKYTWMKTLPDGGREWYEWGDNNEWTLVKTEAAPAVIDHTHSEFGNIAFTGTITIDELTAKTVAIPYTKPGGATGTLQFHDGLLVNNT